MIRPMMQALKFQWENEYWIAGFGRNKGEEINTESKKSESQRAFSTAVFEATEDVQNCMKNFLV
jgi:hypothetical protein